MKSYGWDLSSSHSNVALFNNNNKSIQGAAKNRQNEANQEKTYFTSKNDLLFLAGNDSSFFGQNPFFPFPITLLSESSVPFALRNKK